MENPTVYKLMRPVYMAAGHHLIFVDGGNELHFEQLISQGYLRPVDSTLVETDNQTKNDLQIEESE